MIVDGVELRASNDGTWLRFKASNGKEALICIEALAEEHHAGIIRGALLQWCLDRQADRHVMPHSGSIEHRD